MPETQPDAIDVAYKAWLDTAHRPTGRHAFHAGYLAGQAAGAVARSRVPEEFERERLKQARTIANRIAYSDGAAADVADLARAVEALAEHALAQLPKE